MSPSVLLGIPHVARRDLLDRAIASVSHLLASTLVVDNSNDELGRLSVEVASPPVPLSFAQSMNLLRRVARERHRDVLVVLHSDAAPAPGTPERLLEIVADAECSGRQWGVVFTNYDAFAAFSLRMMDRVGPFDTNLPHYFADNDYYRRVRLAGFELVDTGLPVLHDHSSTINSDRRRLFLNAVTFPLHERYYVAKWGGPPGEETFDAPFGGEVDGIV